MCDEVMMTVCEQLDIKVADFRLERRIIVDGTTGNVLIRSTDFQGNEVSYLREVDISDAY